MNGTIIKGMGGLYTVRDEQGDCYVLRAKGKFRRQGVSPLVGDRVAFTPGTGDEHGWVNEILPRSSCLVRPPVANIEKLVLVASVEPEPDFLLIDRMLIFCRQQGIIPVIVINKSELDESLAEKFRAQYAGAEVQVLAASAHEGRGIEELKEILRGSLCCFAGQSGVGKSSLLSVLTGRSLETGEISQKILRGKNTTRHTELLLAEGLAVLDTPGFSLLELQELMDPVQLKNYYPEFLPYEGCCRFAPCYHDREPGCAVLQAGLDGKIDAKRLERYHLLLEQVRKEWKERYD